MIRTKLCIPEKTMVRFLRSLFHDLGNDVVIHSTTKAWTTDGIQFEVDHTIQPPVNTAPILLEVKDDSAKED